MPFLLFLGLCVLVFLLWPLIKAYALLLIVAAVFYWLFVRNRRNRL